MSDTAANSIASVIITAILMALLMSFIADREISKHDKQITVLQTQLQDAKESQQHADVKFNLCMSMKNDQINKHK